MKIFQYVKKKERVRNRRYILSDNYFNFYFRFIYPNKSELLEKGFMANFGTKYNQYLGFIFEKASKEFLIENKPFFQFTKIKRWWHKNREIDLVAINEKTKEILFVECKWKDNVNAKKILNELKEKSKFVDWNNKKRKEYFCVIAKSFREKIKEKNVLLFDLKDF